MKLCTHNTVYTHTHTHTHTIIIKLNQNKVKTIQSKHFNKIKSLLEGLLRMHYLQM